MMSSTRKAHSRSLRVHVACRTHPRPCRRTITVAVRAKGRRVVVGRRRVALRRTARVRVRLSAKGHAALATGRRLRVSVRGADLRLMTSGAGAKIVLNGF